MCQQHEKGPLSLLIMGGDQLYADEIWESSLAPTIVSWSRLVQSRRISYRVGVKIPNELSRFYETLNMKPWSNPEMAHMIASVPTVMMWDDHDINDGWGMYNPNLQGCELFREIFRAARWHFESFQLRSHRNDAMLNDKAHGAFGLRFA